MSLPKRMNEQEARADKLKEKNECDIPFCENYTTNYYAFDTKSIKCMQCDKCFCEECCDKIWKGEWDDETFAKPKLVCSFLKHEVWTCPFCRASFDRMTPCEEEKNEDTETETDTDSESESDEPYVSPEPCAEALRLHEMLRDILN